VHLHARNPETRKPDHNPGAFAAFLPRIKESTDAVINLTSGGAPYMKIEERIQPAIAFKPEVASLNMGSMNFGLFPMLHALRSSDTHGSATTWRTVVTWCSEIPLGTSSMRCGLVLVTAPVLNSSAMT
jgi:uncharacterized protein (DUF849 family)